MKKIAIAVLSAVCVFALAGCADDVTMDNEQNDIVAEYIAGTLLRHSYANEWKYSKLSNPTFNKSGQSTTTTGKNNTTGTTAANKQTTTAVGQTGTTSTTGTTQAGIKAASITEALGLSGVTVSYKKVSVGNRYPTDAYAVCVPADSGCKVVAVEFTIKNTGSAVYNATTKSANVTMKLSAGSGTYTQYKSMLKNDICNLEQISTSKGISMIIVNSDWTTFYVSTHGDEMLLERLKKSIFNNDIFQNIPSKSNSDSSNTDGSTDNNGTSSDSRNGQNSGSVTDDNNMKNDFGDLSDSDKSSLFGGNSDNNGDKKTPPEKIIDMSGNGANEVREIILENHKYTVQEVYDSRLLDDYIELWGTLDNGDFILIRTPIQSVKDNVHISNTLITYVGIGTLLIGVVAAFVLSSYISRPIKQLSDIAERMSNLDFEAHYEGNDKGEIGLLGDSMNNMSHKLEENISQLKAANLELQRDIDKKEKLEQMRTDFLSNVSHELKTPIALIQGYAEGLKEGITDDPESMDFYCDVIIDEANKMNNMVKRLLTLNQIEFGEDELVMERFDINELVKSVAAANELRASQKELTIQTFMSEEPLYVWADEYKVEEVITNYISNAINHCCNENIIKVNIPLRLLAQVFMTGISLNHTKQHFTLNTTDMVRATSLMKELHLHIS
jgi:two-component system, OmpR family, sensor histidine kinase VanS